MLLCNWRLEYNGKITFKNILTENSYLKLFYIAQCYCIFDQINAVLLNIRDFLQRFRFDVARRDAEGLLKAQMCLLVEQDKQDIRMSEHMTSWPVSNEIVKAALSRLRSVFIKYQTWGVYRDLLIKPLLSWVNFPCQGCDWEIGSFYFLEAEKHLQDPWRYCRRSVGCHINHLGIY